MVPKFGYEKYKDLVENLQEGIWEIDKDNNTSFVNQKMAEILGYTVEEMIGKSVFDFMDKKGEKICKRNLQRRKEGIKDQYESEFLRKDGSKVWTLVATTPLVDKEGNYIGALAGVQDITNIRNLKEEKKEIEKMFKSIVDTSVDGIYKVDKKRRLVFVNNAFENIYGYKAEEIIGKDIKFLRSKNEINESGLERNFKLLMAGKSVHGENINRHKEGHDVHIYYNAVPLKKNNKVIGMLGVVKDLSGQEEVERRRKEIRKVIKETFKDKPFLRESVKKGAISYSDIVNIISQNNEFPKKEMADVLEEYSKELEGESSAFVVFDKNTEVSLESNLFEINFCKGNNGCVNKIIDSIDRGDVSLLSYSNREVTFVTKKAYRDKIEKIVEESGVKILREIDGLSAVTVKLGIECVDFFGVYYLISRALSWAEISVVELFSTLTELSFVVRDKDALKTMDVLKGLVQAH